MASSASSPSHKAEKSIPSEGTAFLLRRSRQNRKSPLSSPAISRKSNPGLGTLVETTEADHSNGQRRPRTIARPRSPSPSHERQRIPAPAFSPMTMRRLESKHLAAKIRQSSNAGFGSPEGRSPVSSPVGSPSMMRRIIVGRGGVHRRRFTLAKMK